MLRLEYPFMFISLTVALVGAFLLPWLERISEDRIVSLMSFILLAIPGFLALIISLTFGLQPGVVEPALFSHPEIGSFAMYLDNLNSLFFLGVGIVTPVVALYSYDIMENRLVSMQEEGENPPSLGIFYLFYTLFSVGMFGFVLTTNLFMQYIFLSLALVSSYVLILFYGHGERESVANIYLVWSLVGGAAFFLGVIGLGAKTGTYDILNLSTLELNLGMGAGLPIIVPFLIFFGMSIKMALFGVHIWLPKAHSQAPAPVSALLSGNLIGLSGYVMIRIVIGMFPSQFRIMAPFFVILAFLTMLYGGLNAIAQDDLKTLLAYSSISQMGWITFGIAIMTQKAMIGGAVLFVTQSLSSSLLFMGAGVIMHKYDGLRDISNMGELMTLNPVLSSIIVIGFSTLIGAPLTVGFWGKTLIFSGATTVAAGYGPIIFILVALAIIFAGGVTASYSLITMKRMLFGMFKGDVEPPNIGWSVSTLSMAIVGLTGVILFFTPESIMDPREIPRLTVLTVEGLMFLTAYLGAYTIFSGGIRYYLVLLSHKIESEIIDKFFHKRMISWVEAADKAIEEAHPTDFSTYLLWLIIGFVTIVSALVFLFPK